MEAGAAQGGKVGAASATTAARLAAWWRRQPLWLQKCAIGSALGLAMVVTSLANTAATRVTLAYVVSGSALLAVQALGHAS